MIIVVDYNIESGFYGMTFIYESLPHSRLFAADENTVVKTVRMLSHAVQYGVSVQFHSTIPLERKQLILDLLV